MGTFEFQRHGVEVSPAFAFRNTFQPKSSYHVLKICNLPAPTLKVQTRHLHNRLLMPSLKIPKIPLFPSFPVPCPCPTAPNLMVSASFSSTLSVADAFLAPGCLKLLEKVARYPTKDTMENHGRLFASCYNWELIRYLQLVSHLSDLPIMHNLKLSWDVVSRRILHEIQLIRGILGEERTKRTLDPPFLKIFTLVVRCL
jgi:hypothetical protein